MCRTHSGHIQAAGTYGVLTEGIWGCYASSSKYTLELLASDKDEELATDVSHPQIFFFPFSNVLFCPK